MSGAQTTDSDAGGIQELTVLEMLKMPLQYHEIDQVTVQSHPAMPIDDLLEEAATELERVYSALRQIVSRCRGDEFHMARDIAGICALAMP